MAWRWVIERDNPASIGKMMMEGSTAMMTMHTMIRPRRPSLG